MRSELWRGALRAAGVIAAVMFSGFTVALWVLGCDQPTQDEARMFVDENPWIEPSIEIWGSSGSIESDSDHLKIYSTEDGLTVFGATGVLGSIRFVDGRAVCDGDTGVVEEGLTRLRNAMQRGDFER